MLLPRACWKMMNSSKRSQIHQTPVLQMRTPMHEYFQHHETWSCCHWNCANPLHSHRLVATKSTRKFLNFFLVIFNYEPKVLQCPVQCDGVEKAHSPILLLSFVVSITVVRGAREHLGQPHCLPASWFLEIFCMWLCTGIFDIKCYAADKKSI